MPSNAELEIAVRKVAAEVATLKEALSQIFNHPDLTMELRKRWNSLTKPTVESPVSEPKPPEKGEAQRHLEYLGSLETIFKKNKGESNVNSNSNTTR